MQTSHQRLALRRVSVRSCSRLCLAKEMEPGRLRQAAWMLKSHSPQRKPTPPVMARSHAAQA